MTACAGAKRESRGDSRPNPSSIGSKSTGQAWRYPIPPTSAAELVPSLEVLPLSCVQAFLGVFGEAIRMVTAMSAIEGAPLTTIGHSCGFRNPNPRTDAR